MNALSERAQLARAVLSLAFDGAMPDSYWLTDSRIAMACAVLGIEPALARQWVADRIAELAATEAGG